MSNHHRTMWLSRKGCALLLLLHTTAIADISLNGVCGDVNGITASTWNGLALECAGDTFPTNIATSITWWVADDLTTNAGPTQTIADRCGNYNLINSGADTTWGAELDADLNGHDAIRFDGSDDDLRAGSFAASQAFTVWMVVKYRGTADGNNHALFSTTGFQTYCLKSVTARRIDLYAGSGYTTSEDMPGTTTYFLLQVDYNGASSEIYVNGGLVSGGGGDAGANGMTGFRLASYVGGAGFYGPIDFVEGGAFSENPDSSERDALWTYVQDRYGL